MVASSVAEEERDEDEGREATSIQDSAYIKYECMWFILFLSVGGARTREKWMQGTMAIERFVRGEDSSIAK